MHILYYIVTTYQSNTNPYYLICGKYKKDLKNSCFLSNCSNWTGISREKGDENIMNKIMVSIGVNNKLIEVSE